MKIRLAEVRETIRRLLISEGTCSHCGHKSPYHSDPYVCGRCREVHGDHIPIEEEFMLTGDEKKDHETCRRFLEKIIRDAGLTPTPYNDGRGDGMATGSMGIAEDDDYEVSITNSYDERVYQDGAEKGEPIGMGSIDLSNGWGLVRSPDGDDMIFSTPEEASRELKKFFSSTFKKKPSP